MKRILEKMGALVMIAAVVFMFAGIPAKAATEIASWSATDVNIPGVPASETKPAHVTMTASGERYTCIVQEMSNIANRTVTVTSDRLHPMDRSVKINAVQSMSWYLNKGNLSKNVTYTVSAYTSLPTSLYASGIIVR